MSAISLSMEGAQQIATQINALANSVNNLAERQAANTRATTAGARASRDNAAASASAAQSTQNFAQAAQNSVQRVQGVASAIQSLVSQLGGENRTAGLVASLAANTAQFAQMGAMLGPTGAIIGGIAGLTAGIVGLISQQQTATEVAREHAAALREEGAAAAHAAEEISRARNVTAATVGGAEGRLALTDFSDSDLVSERNARLAAAEDRRANLREAEARRAGLGAHARDSSGSDLAALFTGERVRTVGEEADARVAAARRSVDAIESEITALENEIETRGRAEVAARSEARAREEAAAERERLASEREVGDRALADEEGKRRGGRSAPTPLTEDSATTEGDLLALSGFDMNAVLAEDRAHRLEEAAALAERIRAEDEADFETWAANRAESLEALKERNTAAAEAEHEHMRALEELRNEVRDGIADFSHGYVDSLDAVIASYRELQDAAKETGVTLNASGLLMSRGMTAVGNQITDVVGTDMTGAFNSALGAWLDGSKSFVEAAEEMAKGVIKALVQESIVQGVTELARGIADLASYRYDSAALHFAAAAAWAVVGGVAGGIGAATGAFGGSKGAEGASQRDMADRDRERSREPAGPTVVNLYYDGLPMTQSEVGAGVARGLRTAQRHGYLPAGALGGR